MSFLQNIKHAKKTLIGIGLSLAFLNYKSDEFLKRYVFGVDGNGGEMLNIYTYLTDQEIAHLRYIKRYSWHQEHKEKDSFKATMPFISDEELEDLGINFPKDRSVEYNKRPPHDFYL